MGNLVDRLPMPWLSLQSGMMIFGGIVIGLIGVLLARYDGSGWWVLLAVGGICVFGGAVTYYQNDPETYSTGDGWLVVGVVCVIVELALLALVVYPML